MAETINRGPNASIGSLTDGRVEVLDGPSVEYQGMVLPDPRFTPMAKDGLMPGRVPGFWNSSQFIVIDSIPSASSTSAIAAAQAPSTTTGVALNLVTAVTGTAAGVPVFTPGVSIVPFGSSAATTVSAIDFGFATATTTANSSTVAVQDNTIFSTGQWIIIGGASAVSNKALIAQIASVSGANLTTIFISPVAGSTINNAPVGQGNLYGNLAPAGGQLGQAAQASAFAAEPYQVAGFSKAFDPRQAVARNVVIASVSTTSGTGTFLVTGYDVYGNLMHELITCTASPGGIGQKCFKYIQSITVQTAATTVTPSNVGVGNGNRIGFPMRSNKWEYLDIFWSGAFTVTNNGWTAAVTGTATNTTGDVRGYQDVASAVIGSTGVSTTGIAFNGVGRITINQAIEQNSMLFANPLNATSLFGWPQA